MRALFFMFSFTRCFYPQAFERFLPQNIITESFYPQTFSSHKHFFTCTFSFWRRFHPKTSSSQRRFLLRGVLYSQGFLLIRKPTFCQKVLVHTLIILLSVLVLLNDLVWNFSKISIRLLHIFDFQTNATDISCKK